MFEDAVDMYGVASRTFFWLHGIGRLLAWRLATLSDCIIEKRREPPKVEPRLLQRQLDLYLGKYFKYPTRAFGANIRYCLYGCEYANPNSTVTPISLDSGLPNAIPELPSQDLPIVSHAPRQVIVPYIYVQMLRKLLHDAAKNEENVAKLPGLIRSESHTKVLVCLDQHGDLPNTSANLPCHLTLYRKSTIASFSCIPKALKCLRTAFANCSLPCLRWSLRLAIVGENSPMPGRESSSWLYSLLKADGVSTR